MVICASIILCLKRSAEDYTLSEAQCRRLHTYLQPEGLHMKYRKTLYIITLGLALTTVGCASNSASGISNMPPLPVQAATTSSTTFGVAKPLQATTEGRPVVSIPVSGVSWSTNGRHTDCSVQGNCLHNHKAYEGRLVHIDDDNHERIASAPIRNGVVVAVLPQDYLVAANARINLKNVYIGGDNGRSVGYPHISCGIGTKKVSTHACPIVKVK